MTDADPANTSGAIASRSADLTLRVCSALVLVPLAVGTAYIGGWPFAIFWSLAAIGIFWEWTSLVAGEKRRPVVMVGGSALALALALAGGGRPMEAIIVIAMGVMGTAAIAPARHRGWVAGGLPYAGAIGIAPIVCGRDEFPGGVGLQGVAKMSPKLRWNPENDGELARTRRWQQEVGTQSLRARSHAPSIS